MAAVLLASASLFVLLVTGRPVPSISDQVSSFVPTTSTVQAAFHVYPGDDVKLEAARFQSPKQQIDYLSKLNVADITDIASFAASVKLDETVGRKEVSDMNSESDSDRAHAIRPSEVGKQQGSPFNDFSTTTLVVLVFSCVTAFLALISVALALYFIKLLWVQMLASTAAWQSLPRLWNPNSTGVLVEKNSLRDSGLLQENVGEQCLIQAEAEEGSAEIYDKDVDDNPLYLDAASDMDSEMGVEEKYQDALDSPPLAHHLSPAERVSCQSRSCFDYPPLPISGSRPVDQSTSNRTPGIRGSSSSPGTRPPWTLRAVDSLSLGLSSCGSDNIDTNVHPLVHSRRRAYRSAVPEFDFALALQLRQGIGIDADSAWVVRFMVTIFGWFAVALTGSTR